MPSSVLPHRIPALLLVAALAGCNGGPPASIREITITTVPLLVKEQTSVFPFLGPAFAAGGVLNGKEVYAFVPSTVTVAQGDTIHFTFINPEDDTHTFVLGGLTVLLPGNKVTTASYVAKNAGIFPFRCTIPTHVPMMRGELVVLARSSIR